MKRICLMLAVFCLLTFCAVACSDAGYDDGAKGGKTETETTTEEEKSSETKETGSDSGQSTGSVNPTSVAAYLSGLVNATTADEIAGFVTTPSEEYASRVLQAFPDKDYVVTAKKLGSYKDITVFSFAVKQKSNDDFLSEGIELFVEKNGKIMVQNDPDVISDFVENCSCSACGGKGHVTTNGTACGICGGTGQTYVPNVYYDPTLQMWQGQWQACSGCGGAGMLGAATTACSGCGGRGFVLR